jgi:hypothetical protein
MPWAVHMGDNSSDYAAAGCCRAAARVTDGPAPRHVGLQEMQQIPKYIQPLRPADISPFSLKKKKKIGRGATVGRRIPPNRRMNEGSVAINRQSAADCSKCPRSPVVSAEFDSRQQVT